MDETLRKIGKGILIATCAYSAALLSPQAADRFGEALAADDYPEADLQLSLALAPFDLLGRL